MEYKAHPATDFFPLLPELELAALAEDMRQNGQQLPIVMWRGQIVDGRNRWCACKLAGRQPVTEEREFADDAAAALFVVSMNIHRRHLTESQRGMLGARLKDLFAKAAKERQLAAQNNQAGRAVSANLREQVEGRKAADDAARAANVSARTVESASRVLRDGAAALVAAVDSAAVSVSAAADLAVLPKAEQEQIVARGEQEILSVAKQLRAKRAEERRQERIGRLRDAPELFGNYRVVYADPPWKYGDSREELTGTTGAEHHYPTMTIEELCALPVAEHTEEDAVLFLWATSPMLEVAFDVINAWGFTYKTSFVWDKVRHNLGHYNSVRHEFLLICTRGSCKPDVPKLHDSVIEIERTDKHSQKPREFRDMIDSLYTFGRRVELFCREPAEGWDSWGNEVDHE